MAEAKRFFSSLGWLLLLNALVKPLWIFGIDRTLQNQAGNEAYGSYFAVLNLALVGGFLLDWGLTGFASQRMAAQTPNRGLHWLSSLMGLKVLFSLLYIIMVCVVAWWSGIRQGEILAWVVLVQVLHSWFLFFRAQVTARQWFRTDAWLSVLDKGLLLILAGGYLLFSFHDGLLSIPLFLRLQACCTALALFTVLFLLRFYRLPFSPGGSLRVHFSMLRQALPFALLVFLMSAHYRLDGFLLERIHPDGARQAGVYAAAYRLLDAANMPGYLLATFLLPFVARHAGNKEMLQPVILRSRHLLLLFSIGVSATAWMFSDPIRKLLYTGLDEQASLVLQMTLPALIGYSLTQIYGTVLTATGHVVTFCGISALALFLNIFLNLLLMPRFGALGSAWAALISHGAGGMLAMWAVNRKCRLDTDLCSLLIYIFMAGALLLFYRLLWRSGWMFLWQLAAGALLLLLLALLSDFLRFPLSKDQMVK